MRKTKRRKRKKTNRVCLKCDREFMSDGIYNRICSNCRESNANIALGNIEPREVYCGGDLRDPDHMMRTGAGPVKENW